MIYCVWYPSGGFGHFINAVLTLHGNNFVRPVRSLEFSNNGNSHKLDLVVPKYFHECWTGGIEFRDDKNYCVLIDNGINSNSDQFKIMFPDSTVVKICYSDRSWPMVARTMIDKAMKSNIEEQLPVDEWATDESWARREKYFLFLRDHDLRRAWRSDDTNAIYLEELYADYEEFFNTVNSIAKIEQCEGLWQEWRIANTRYIDPVRLAENIINYVAVQWPMDLSNVQDTWTQSIVYYYIWLRFNFEVPHNTYSNWFTNTTDIVKMLVDHGVIIDSN
jgi:hypothetical protein